MRPHSQNFLFHWVRVGLRTFLSHELLVRPTLLGPLDVFSLRPSHRGHPFESSVTRIRKRAASSTHPVSPESTETFYFKAFIAIYWKEQGSDGNIFESSESAASCALWPVSILRQELQTLLLFSRRQPTNVYLLTPPHKGQFYSFLLSRNAEGGGGN